MGSTDPFLLRLCVLFLGFLLALSSVDGIKMDSKTPFPTPAYPAYLPKKQMDSIIHAHQHHFYDNSVKATRNFLKKNMDLERIVNMYGTKAEDDKPTCIDLIIKATLAYFAGIPYARQVDDSQGKEESGLLKGNYMWFGRYRECASATNGEDITGKMCTSIYSEEPDSTDGLQISSCFPDICTEQEITDFIQTLTDPNMTTTYISTRCPTPVELDAVDITFIVICALLGAFVFFGTTYEIYGIVQTNEKDKNEVIRENNSEQPSVLAKLGLSFSAIKNTTSLLDMTQKEGNIDVLHGLRFISMSWVILGHTFTYTLGATDNLVDISEFVVEHGTFQAIINGTLSVDTFFFLSGLLVAYIGMKEITKRGGKLNVPLMYLSRYLRLTPTMGLVMLIAVSLMPIIVEGPLEPIGLDPQVELCRKYWWTNLLYINNLYPAELGQECIGWVWYLANDMQFYLLSPILLYLLYKYPKVGLGIIAGLVLANMAIVGALSTHHELYPDSVSYAYLCRVLLYYVQASYSGTTVRSEPLPTGSEYFDDIYAKPWCRIGVYMIGMATGYILYTKKGKIKMNKVFVTIMWVVVAATELSLIYGWTGFVYDVDMSSFPTQNVASFYNAVMRQVWAFGLVWITIACVSGYGGPINSFLSWKFFIPLSRLTFCAYLIHPLVLMYMYYSREIELHFELNIMIYYFCAALTLSYGIAYILHLIIEAPVAGIQKIIFPSKRRQEPQSNSKNSGRESNGEAVAVTEMNGHMEYVSENGNAIGTYTSEKHGEINEILPDDTTEADAL